MPRYKKKNNKSKNKQRSRKEKSVIKILGRNPVPVTALVKLRYCQTIGIDASAGVTNVRLFRCNSLYDPDYSSTSTTQHSPLGFEQWMQMYTIYCVVGSKMTATCINTSTNCPIQYGIVLRQGGVNFQVNPNLLKEQGDSHWRYAGNLSNASRTAVTKKFSTKKFLGFKNPTNENSCRASATGNPASSAYFELWCAAADGITNPPNTTFQIMIEYVAVLSQPKKLPFSNPTS